MKKQIVIINGSGGVGKDQFINLCCEYTKVLNVSSIDEVKMAATILGWDGRKSEKDRLFLADLKQLSIAYNDRPYEFIKNQIKRFIDIDSLSNLMFIHIREPNEIDRVKNDFGCKTLFIKNINIPKILSNGADANVENYVYDFIINNDEDLDALKQQARYFITQIFS